MAPDTTSKAPTDVFIVAENRLIREALSRLLKRDGSIRVVSACSFSSEAINQIVDNRPSVLILDPTGRLSSCVQVVVEVTKVVPGLRVIVIGMEADPEIFLRLVRAGISGYLLKDASAGEVVTAVRMVSNGKATCPPELCLALFEWVARQETPRSKPDKNSSLGLTA